MATSRTQSRSTADGGFGIGSVKLQNVAVANTNGTTNVNVFTAPVDLTITGVFLGALDTTAGNITVLNGSDTVVTIAKGTTAGAMVHGTTLANASVSAGTVVQVDSSSAGNARVYITYLVD